MGFALALSIIAMSKALTGTLNLLPAISAVLLANIVAFTFAVMGYFFISLYYEARKTDEENNE